MHSGLWLAVGFQYIPISGIVSQSLIRFSCSSRRSLLDPIKNQARPGKLYVYSAHFLSKLSKTRWTLLAPNTKNAICTRPILLDFVSFQKKSLYERLNCILYHRNSHIFSCCDKIPIWIRKTTKNTTFAVISQRYFLFIKFPWYKMHIF